MPSLFIWAVLCNLPNLLNSLGKSSEAIPTPVSYTETVISYFSKLYLAFIIIFPPFFVNFSAFLIKFIRTYLKRRSSPTKNSGKSSASFINSEYDCWTYRYIWIFNSSAFILRISTTKSMAFIGLNNAFVNYSTPSFSCFKLSKSSTKLSMRKIELKTNSRSRKHFFSDCTYFFSIANVIYSMIN